MTTTTDRPFPIDWNEWHAEWTAWEHANRARLGSRVRSPFPGKNMLADDILGAWMINGRTVELSEVTFPDLSGTRRGERCRYIGVTFADDTDLCETFAELEATLGIAH